MTSDSRPLIGTTLHFVLNTGCNAFDLPAVKGSPGVCRFCYREKGEITTTLEHIETLLTMVRRESDIARICFTGGEPLMLEDGRASFAIQLAKRLGFTVNLHTNGLELPKRYPEIKDSVDVYSLGMDGASAETADWERGVGYFERLESNIEMLIADGRTLAFNTFISPHNLNDLMDIGRNIMSIQRRTNVEYWLISQYRPISRDSAAKRSIYQFSPDQFKEAVSAVERAFPEINLYSQPTRLKDPYPFRVWLMADGQLMVDPGTIRYSRNVAAGNVLTDGFARVLESALAIREQCIEGDATLELPVIPLSSSG